MSGRRGTRASGVFDTTAQFIANAVSSAEREAQETLREDVIDALRYVAGEQKGRGGAAEDLGFRLNQIADRVESMAPPGVLIVGDPHSAKPADPDAVMAWFTATGLTVPERPAVAREAEIVEGRLVIRRVEN